jgi:predicted Zn-dependent protease
VKLSRALALALLASLPVAGTAAAQTSPVTQKTFERGRALMDAKKPADAAAEFDEVTKAEPDFAAGWYALAAARRRAGQCELAIPAYRRYAQMSPAEAEPYYGLGLCLKETGQLASAAQALRRYVDLVDLKAKPSAGKWVEHAKIVIDEIGSGTDAPKGAAAQPLAPAVKGPAPGGAAPTSAPPPPAIGASPATGAGAPPGAGAGAPPEGAAAALYAKSQQLRDAGRIEEAIASFKETIAADPRSMVARAALGELLLKIRRDSEAIDVYRSALHVDPSYSLAWYELAFAFRVRGRLPEAVDAYEHYIKLRPTDPDPYYGLARSLEKLGKKDAARKAYETYVSMEKRPTEQKWVDAANAEIRSLGAP